ncbi:hypothetical protein JGH11_14630 [Dysgonomonas sp. Marseille-P4677]|uniref:hypothetical protein n=1 Tax=Dysgonomonas sp. Marseille-P4677 TaxID=2364790 RepID=UPI001913A15B|nr:hypothetical protein [Dysgonomonas sp. Marseille-P4677]MBK5722111.1 hypothetical protein [Dysgonomonas sp. Marseille-P4677]
MSQEISKVVEAIANDVLRLSQIVLGDNNIGVNQKTGRNTLKDSAMARNVKVEIRNLSESIVIETLLDNYVNYIEQGRKPKQGKQPPIDALRDWALSRGIPSDNSTLFLISRAIWRDGQRGRPILATLEEEIEKQFENKWADMLFEAITDELNKYFD